jgi:inhibitor of cysteine peptidase
MISCGSARSGKMIQVDDSFNGREVTLHTGESLEVRLSENPTTGHRWNEPEEFRSGWTSVLKQVDDTFDSPGPVPGKPGTRILRFEAIQAGNADLVLHNRRSWDKDAEPARIFRLRVQVQPAG